MTKVERLAQEQFNTFRNRLCEMLCEIEEEHKSAFMQGYAKGEKFRTKPDEEKLPPIDTSKYNITENGNVIKEKDTSVAEVRLAKAVEVIEGLMRFCRFFAQHHKEDIRYKEAEQFLSEVKNEQ